MAAMDPATWEQLPNPTRDALWKATQLSDAPVPAVVLAGTEELMEEVVSPAAHEKLVTVAPHPIWGLSVASSPQLRSAIRAGAWKIGGHQLDLLQELVSGFVGYYFSCFLPDVPQMRQSAQELEPHLDTVTELARRLELWNELGQLLHRRALFVSWDGGELERALKYAREAVQAFRRSDGNKPHAGTLSLLQANHAHVLRLAAQPQKARDVLLEAEQNLIAQSGSAGLPLFLLYCQLADASRAADDVTATQRAEHEAKALANDLAQDDAHRTLLLDQVAQTRSWPLWHLHQYQGL